MRRRAATCKDKPQKAKCGVGISKTCAECLIFLPICGCAVGGGASCDACLRRWGHTDTRHGKRLCLLVESPDRSVKGAMLDVTDTFRNRMPHMQ